MAESRRTEPLYHVPRSQVWEGSRGRQSGKVHLHVDGRALCGRRGWYERAPMEGEEACPRCVAKAEKQGIQWPNHHEVWCQPDLRCCVDGGLVYPEVVES
jgi:hypothetical protein